MPKGNLMSHRIPTGKFIVACKDRGRYRLATQRLFPTHDTADAYCDSIHESREPVVIESEAILILIDGWYEATEAELPYHKTEMLYADYKRPTTDC